MFDQCALDSSRHCSVQAPYVLQRHSFHCTWRQTSDTIFWRYAVEFFRYGEAWGHVALDYTVSHFLSRHCVISLFLNSSAWISWWTNNGCLFLEVKENVHRAAANPVWPRLSIVLCTVVTDTLHSCPGEASLQATCACFTQKKILTVQNIQQLSGYFSTAELQDVIIWEGSLQFSVNILNTRPKCNNKLNNYFVDVKCTQIEGMFHCRDRGAHQPTRDKLRSCFFFFMQSVVTGHNVAYLKDTYTQSKQIIELRNTAEDLHLI